MENDFSTISAESNLRDCIALRIEDFTGPIPESWGGESMELTEAEKAEANAWFDKIEDSWLDGAYEAQTEFWDSNNNNNNNNMNETYIAPELLFQIQRGLELRIADLKNSIAQAKQVDSDSTYWEESLVNAQKIQKQMLSSYRVVIK